MGLSRKKSQESKINWKEKSVSSGNYQMLWLIQSEDIKPLVEKYELNITIDRLASELNLHLSSVEFHRELIDYSPQANDKKMLFKSFQHHVEELQELCQIFTNYGSPCELFKDDQQTKEKQQEQWSEGSNLIYGKLKPLLEECSAQFKLAIYNLEKSSEKNVVAVEKHIQALQSNAQYFATEIAKRKTDPTMIRYPEELEQFERMQKANQEDLEKKTKYLQFLKDNKPTSKGNTSTRHAHFFIEMLYGIYNRFCSKPITISWISSRDEYQSEFVNFVEDVFAIVRHKFIKLENGDANKFDQIRLTYLLENMPESNKEIGDIAMKVRKKIR